MEYAKRFGVSISSELLKKFDKKIEERMYTNRSEAIRDLIRDFLVEEEWKDPNEQIIGSLTLIYDHDVSGISDELTDLQHSAEAKVLSSMHLHLDKHNCMEIIAIKGKAKEVKETSDKLISRKGVKHGKLVMTSPAEL